jgi:stearoyl-CoA desaturase (delta-9 desaturase)
LVVGFFTSTVLLWHSTFLVNSLAHVMGRRRYETDDTSKNSLIIALITAGEGWHNNHHRYQSSARQGFRWWQIDTTYYGLWMLSKVGIVKDLRPVPQRVIDEGRRKR